VYVGFTFAAELDVLEVHLSELYDGVDGFILVEAAYSHSGSRKPLHFHANRHRFARYLDKIEHVVLPSFPFDCSPEEEGRRSESADVSGYLRDGVTGDRGRGAGAGAGGGGRRKLGGGVVWGCEHYQRDAILQGAQQMAARGLAPLREDDWLVIADVDEV
jgi:hypothetical protein